MWFSLTIQYLNNFNITTHTNTFLYCIVLYCIVLYRTVPYRTVPYCIVLYCIVLYLLTQGKYQAVPMFDYQHLFVKGARAPPQVCSRGET